MNAALSSLRAVQAVREKRAQGLAYQAAATAFDARAKKQAARVALSQNERAAADAWATLTGSPGCGHAAVARATAHVVQPCDQGDANVRPRLAPVDFHRYAAHLAALRAQRVALLSAHQLACRTVDEADAAASDAMRGWTKVKERARQIRERMQRDDLDQVNATEQDVMEDASLCRWHSSSGAGAPLF